MGLARKTELKEKRAEKRSQEDPDIQKSGRKWTSKQTRAGRTRCGEGLDGRAEE